jgi:hypothetical protein
LVGNVYKAVTAVATDARGTDYLRLRVLSANTTTNAVTWTVLQNKVLPLSTTGKIVVYAGSDKAADCECRPDHSCHCYCQQVKVCLETRTLPNGTVRFTATAWALGSGPAGGGRHANPFDQTMTLLDTAVYEGPLTGLLAGVPTSGSVGIAASNIQGVIKSSFTNFTIAP